MPMLRLPWTIVNGITATFLLSAAVMLMVPTEFHRYNNETITVPIDWSNLLCEVPKPNINVTEREVYDFWQLPMHVRLSPRMAESGRCCVAVDQYNAKRPYKISPSVCYCFNTWWVPVVSLVSFAMGLLSLLHFVSGVITRKTRMIADNEASAHSRCEVVRNLLFAVVTLIFLANVKNDFNFTNYGDLYPSDYLNSLPMTWVVAMWLFLGGNMGQSITCIFLKSCAKRCTKPKKTSHYGSSPILPLPNGTSSKSPESPKAFQNASVQTRVTYSGMRIERESPNTGSITSRAKSTVSGSPSTVLFTVCECVSLSENSETASSLSTIMLTTSDEAQQKATDRNAKSEMPVGKEEEMRKDGKEEGEKEVSGPIPPLSVIPTTAVEQNSQPEPTKTEVKTEQPSETVETVRGGKGESKPEPLPLIVTPGIAVKVSGGNEKEKPKSEVGGKSQNDGQQSASERNGETNVVSIVADGQGGKKV